MEMTPDCGNNIYDWVDSILAILESNDPQRNLMYFLLDFEQEVYNRAIVDAMKNIGELNHIDKRHVMGTLMSLRLSSMPMIKKPPKLRSNIIQFKPAEE